MQYLFPLFRLLGGSLKNQVIGGSLFSFRGVMICEENRDVLNHMLPENFELPVESMKSCEPFITDYQYTRGDAERRNDSAEILDQQEHEKETKTNLMIYNGQAVLPGALFYHGFILNNISRLEVGALLLSLREWISSGSFLGGMSRIGHGKVETKIIPEYCADFFDSEIDFEKSVEQYEEHVFANKEKCIAWLNIS